ncbi:MAG: MFS transporter [Nitrospinae bacterium]|nr:MFS transporter [Nitrospinota bacterium]
MTALLNEQEKPTSLHYKILFLSWAGWVFDFYDLVLYTFLLIPIGVEMGLDNIRLSWILGASLAATALGGVVFGVLSDQIGRKKVLQLTIVVYSAGTLLSGLSWGIWSLIFFRIITGLGVGGEWAAGQTFVGETFHPKVRGKYAALMQTGAPVGVALASVVGGLLGPEIGWRSCFVLSGLPALMVIYIRTGLPESDVWLESQRKGVQLKTSQLFADFIKKFLHLFSPEIRKHFLMSFILTALGLSAYWLTYSWMPGYLYQQRHFTMIKSAAWILVTQSGGFLGYLSFGFVADRLGRRPAFSIYSALMALGLAMITVFWDVVAQSAPVALGFMFMVGFGTGFFSGFGPVFAELFPTSIRNTAMGSAFNLARGIQFFTPVVVATIAAKYGLGGGIFLASFFALLTGAWIWAFPETKGKALDS